MSLQRTTPSNHTNPRYDDEEFIHALKTKDSSLTIQEVAERVGCSRSTAWRRLTQLKNVGAIERHDEQRPYTWESNIYVPSRNVSNLPYSWRNATRGWGNSLHKISPYVGGFPPSLAHYFIKRFSETNDVVYDPFVGGGTVPLEAVLQDRVGWGSDVFEYATVLSRAKCHPMSTDEFETYLISVLDAAETIDNPTKFLDNKKPKTFFSDYTLRQLLAVREVLRGDKSREATYLRAIISGVLHGPSEMFLSLSTRDTFSGSVDYVKDYKEEHGLETPKKHIWESATTKQDLVTKDFESFPDDPSARIEQADSANVPFAENSVDLLLTSPPYMRVLDYSWNNWLRLWWLDVDRKSEREKLTITESESKYKKFVKNTLAEIERVLSNNGYAIIIVGDVRKRMADRIEYINTARMFAEEAKNRTELNPRQILNDEYDHDARNYAMANQLKYEYSREEKEEKSMSTLDRCLILSPHEEPLPPADDIELPWN